jgi:hypothetical protein
VTKRYLLTTGYNATSSSWQRCVPVSAHVFSGSTDNYELQMQSSISNAAIKFRLVHSVNTIASTPTVNINATYAQNDVPIFASLTGNAQYTDANWATYGYVSSTVLTQVGGQIGVGTLAPSAKFHVAGGSAQFDSNVTVTGTLGAGASTLGTLSCTAVTTNNSNITAGSGSITSGQHNPTNSATYDLGASATAWRSAFFSSNLTVGGAITGSNSLTLPGQYTCSLQPSFDTTANGVKDLATFTSTAGSGHISFDISVILSQTGTAVTKRYLLTTGYNATSSSWQRCVPVSAHVYAGVTDNYELQMQSSLAPTAIKFRLVHSINTIASTSTVNINANYAQNDVPVFASLTGNAQYTDASWATYGFVSSTALTQVGGQIGVGTLAPSAKFHVAGGSAQFDSNVTV